MTFVIVIDGLRPDSINERDTPSLHRLRLEGTNFTNAHATFPTGTRVNAATIATGVYPDRHGILNNAVFLPEIMSGRPSGPPPLPDLIRAQQELEGGLLRSETLADILARRGMKVAVASSASSSSTFLLNPRAPEEIGVLVNGSLDPPARLAYPDDVNREVIGRFAPAPPKRGGIRSRNPLVDWTQEVVENYVLPELAPDVLIDWFTEPDHSQHAHGVGSPEALDALANVDRNVSRLLEQIQGATRANVIVMSDHGVTRYDRAIDVRGRLVEAGLKAGAESRDLLVVANGPSAQLFVRGRDEETIKAIAAHLQRQEWAGAVFTPTHPPGAGRAAPSFRDGAGGSGSIEPRGWVDGTLSLDLLRLAGSDRSCDVLVTFPWSSAANEFGVPGTETTTSRGKGNLHSGHGGISEWALRSTMILWGPAFKHGSMSAAPSAHVDVAPTVLRLHGIEAPEGLDGRVLEEALREGPDAETLDVKTRSFRASVSGGYGAAIQISEVEGRLLVDKSWRLPDV